MQKASWSSAKWITAISVDEISTTRTPEDILGFRLITVQQAPVKDIYEWEKKVFSCIVMPVVDVSIQT